MRRLYLLSAVALGIGATLCVVFPHQYHLFHASVLGIMSLLSVDEWIVRVIREGRRG